MGRPKRVRYDTFHLYDKLHTNKIKMMDGIETTTLYPIKETAQFYLSIEVWAYCSHKFKAKKPFKLNVDIPLIKDERTIAFLDEHCWKDWVDKERGDKKSDLTEAISLLDKLFPGKEKIFFYELDSLMALYIQGSLISYDDNGNLEEQKEHDIDHIKYYNLKYNMFSGEDVPEIKKAYDAYCKEKNEKLKTEKFKVYHDLSKNYAYEHNNLVDVFIEIGENSVCYPVAFSRGTAEWSKKKYGKEIAYAKAGEIFFVQTPDKVYFEIKRHF